MYTYLNSVANFLRKNGFNSRGGGSNGNVPTASKYILCNEYVLIRKMHLTICS